MLKSIITLSIVLFSFSIYAEDYKGKVLEKKDNKELPLIGVNVYWAGSTTGSITNADGKFEVPHAPENTNLLVFSFVGYQNDTLEINSHKPITVYLNQGADIEEVTVTHRTAAQSISKLSPRMVQNISGKELERCACCNLSESFETNASVDVAFADAVTGVKQIQLLGLSGRYSQIAMGNIPTLRGAESAFGLEYFPGTWMEGLQVSKGTAAVKNGYESITGQINIQLKEPDGKERLHVYTYGNLDGKAELNFGYSFDLNEKWSTSIMAHTNGNFREMDLNNDGFLDKPMSQMTTFMNQWNYDSDHFSSKFGFSYLNEKREGGQVGYNHNNYAFNDSDLYGIYVDVERFSAYAKNGYIFDREATSLGTIFSYNYFDRNSYYGNDTYDVLQQNAYANIIFQSYIGDTRHTYNTGLSVVYDNNDAIYNGSRDNVGYEETTTGVFAEYNYIPSENFSFLAGLRYDYSTLHASFITPRVHAKYNASEHITFRASAGKGYRTPDAIGENSKYMASSKSFYFDENLKQEEAWNYGLSMVSEIPVGEKHINVSVEYYRTDFQNQLIVDMDQNTHEIHFYNLNGESFSNIYQIEASYELFNRFDLSAAYRYNDVQSTYNGELQETPFTNKYKGLISASYRTNMDKWQFDFTAQFNGDQRLPSTQDNAIENQREDRSESYVVLLAQITKNYKNWSFYVGGENLGSYTQKNAIIAADSPFGSDFDASRIYAPLYGAMAYVGVKYIIGK
ncbi:TonB-dependent receptor [Saccharicrinis aurantiacus]|uniref:TonB-dependent receptor n=1 Tax=Saccharicrinis aurantiacus TaxID=1849719 RepID=UPI0024933F8B|nr:TonB-dependent receptor [Saccharicrinis aurantiacus]